MGVGFTQAPSWSAVKRDGALSTGRVRCWLSRKHLPDDSQTTPRRRPDDSQTPATRLPDASQTTPRPLEKRAYEALPRRNEVPNGVPRPRNRGHIFGKRLRQARQNESPATPESRSYIRETPPERTPKRVPGDPEIEVIYSGNASGKHAKTSPRRPRNRGHIFGKRLRKGRQNDSLATPKSRSYIRETPPASTPKRLPGDPRIEVIYSGNASGKDAKTSLWRPQNRGHIFGKRLRKT